MSNARNISKAESRFVNATGDTMSGDIHTSGYVAGDSFHAGNRVAPYTSVSETQSGAMSIVGHNAMAHPSSPNVVTAQQNGYHSHFMKMYYSDGISFHTSSGTRLTGDIVYDHLTPSNVASGTSEKMRIDPLGRVTTPSQPGFFARRSNHVTSTGNIIFDAEAFDTTGAHNNTNGRFTAPVSGRYLFSFSTLLYNMGSSSQANLMVNDVAYGGISCFGTYGSFTGTYAGQGASAVVYLNAGDYVNIYFAHNGTNLHAGYTWWSGYLLG